MYFWKIYPKYELGEDHMAGTAELLVFIGLARPSNLKKKKS